MSKKSGEEEKEEDPICEETIYLYPNLELFNFYFEILSSYNANEANEGKLRAAHGDQTPFAES